MALHNHNLAVICGLARSGTTYVGKALSRARGVHLINEPLNKDFGVKGVSLWYMYAGEDSHSDSIGAIKLIRDIMELRAGWTHSSPPGYPVLTRMSKRVYGGRSGLAWSVLRLKKSLGLPLQTVCFKDPFATFAVDHMIQAGRAKAVCLTKHPGALYISQKRRGQPSHIEDLFAQGRLRELHAPDISDRTWEKAMRQSPVGVALLWKIMARVITSQAKDLAQLIIVRHEDLCNDPIKVIQGICAHLGIVSGPRIEKYIRKTSQGNRIYARRGRLHSFRRNSLALKDAWRSVISPQEEAMIQETVGEDLLLLYEKW
jgi:hypothetical protein